MTDQFKSRSYDMLHIKNTYGDKVLGILVYVKADTGISIDHAKAICYPFDLFVGISYDERHNPEVWNEMLLAIKKFLIS